MYEVYLTTAGATAQELTDESLDKQGDGDDVEDEQVEDVLPVLLEEGDPAVPALPPPVVPALVEGIHAETGHSVNRASGQDGEGGMVDSRQTIL